MESDVQSQAPGFDPERGRHFEIMRLRNEIAWIHSDRAHGGPERSSEMEAIRQRLRELTGGENGNGKRI